MIKRLLERLLALLYPPKCTFCGRLLTETEHDICKKCRASLPVAEQSFKRGMYYTECLSVYYYEQFVAQSVRRFKFAGMEQYAGLYGRLIGMLLLRNKTEFDILSWVPISDKRRRKRGYDQSLLIAQAVARELRVECVRTLQKIKDNQPQSRQHDAAARHANVMNAYRAVEPQRFRGKRVLLIDDVVTTGATLSECSRVLRTAGAESVVCATLAATRIH